MIDLAMILSLSFLAFFFSPSCMCCSMTTDCTIHDVGICTDDELCSYATLVVSKSGDAPTHIDVWCSGDPPDDPTCIVVGTYCLGVRCAETAKCHGSPPNGTKWHTWAASDTTNGPSARFYLYEDGADTKLVGLVMPCGNLCGTNPSSSFASFYSTNPVTVGTTTVDCTSISESGSGGGTSPNINPGYDCDMKDGGDYSWTFDCGGCSSEDVP